LLRASAGACGVDERTIAECQRGDRAAFRALFDAYRDPVYSIALGILNGNQAAAEDVAQEVFVKLFQRIGQYDGRSQFSTWLYRMVVNACLDEKRKSTRTQAVDPEQFPTMPTQPGDGPEALAVSECEAEELRRALADLNPEIRATIVLRHYEDMAYNDMATTLGCSLGTVGSRLSRGYQQLARKLRGEIREPLAGEDSCSGDT
jgi:RNA polymerase sigma-70 factor (ECF subfamily)